MPMFSLCEMAGDCSRHSLDMGQPCLNCMENTGDCSHKLLKLAIWKMHIFSFDTATGFRRCQDVTIQGKYTC